MSNYMIAIICVFLFGIIGIYTIGFGYGAVVGVIVGLLVSILIALERICNILNNKEQSIDIKNKSFVDF